MSKKNSVEKTNVLRILDFNKIEYNSFTYNPEIYKTGEEIAKALNENENQVFKTLVTVSNSHINYVFVVPVSKELDLKKAAHSVNEKSVEMIKQKDLFNLTGYIHGGCSPIGMKKFFKTTVDASASNYQTIMISAGKVGHQVQLSLNDLAKVIDFQLCDITK